MSNDSSHTLLAWQELRYSTVKSNSIEERILDGLSGVAFPRRLLAVMGESGSGKTTFLNAVSSRLHVDGTHKLEGKVFFNNNPSSAISQSVAFVTQQDIFFDTTSPYEAVFFSARVRAALDRESAKKRTNEVLSELMLLDVKDSLLGAAGSLHRGVSGGERKRTNIAVELITDPKVLLLDEPTSGLDSFTALKVVHELQNLARKGRTVVCTIHQPSADIFHLFDDLMLIASGKVVYHGAALLSLDYFQSIGYECPKNFTPTDFFMALLHDETTKLDLINEWSTCVREGKSASYQIQPMFDESVPSHARVSLGHASPWVQFSELFLRSFRNHYRNRYLLFTQLGQSIVFGLFVGLVFRNLGIDQTSVQDRMGLFFLLATNSAFAGAGNVINTFTVERNVFTKEQRSRAYSPLCYFLGKTVGELPFGILNPVVLICIVYFITGLHRDLATFLCAVATMILGYQSGVSFGLFLGVVSPNFFVSSALLPLVLVPLSLAGGMAVSSSRLGKYWFWMEKVSSIRYTFISLANLEFSNVKFLTCDDVRYHGRCASMYHTGTDVLANLGYNSKHGLSISIISLLGIIVLLRASALIALCKLSKKKV
uniref:ABC transporter domain-containing protein n=1 Tax=Paramoeba aestuarina TaxID=180227 RepID=A0A7S4U5Y3_9EUKA|mmetsp:Transcript_34525/g.53884  ORF Transcript_34525/g.53884 Transcript_34525/m.53884 type:complete len:598 (+) Transcript_34525:41-1834(+)